jgi:hypothetical protein
VIGISQSGETADTLAAMRLARERGASVLAITNTRGSQATRDADGVLFTRAGLEIGVAATKTFVCQVAVMYLLGLRLAELRGTLPPERIAALVAELKHMPHSIDELIADCEPRVQEIADTCWQADFFLYIGRHVGLPVALEGALKLKEISYISTDAYAAGEMKHGPIARPREARLQRAGGARARCARDRHRHRRRRPRRGPRRCHAVRAGHRLDAAADPRGDPTAAARLRGRAQARTERRPAPQPGKDGYRRVGRLAARGAQAPRAVAGVCRRLSTI